MRRTIAWISLLGLALGLPGPARAASSLPVVASGPRPGPDVLYAPLAVAPELSNGPGWSAPPLLVSGASAYDSGEFLYQDFVYDSFGANTTNQPFSPPEPVPNSSDVAFGGMTGDMVYPTAASVYGNDAADLLEFRARLDSSGRIVYRVTLNTMLVADAAAVAIGIDSAPGGSDDWGYGIGSLGPLGLEHVVVAAGGDPATNQIEISTNLTPGAQTWRHYVVVGLWDAGAQTFKQVLDQPTATMPGGAHGTNPPPVFNVGFRSDEPMGPGSAQGIANDDPSNSQGTRTVGYGNWRDEAQAKALAARDISTMGAGIDFAKIAAGTDDFAGVPTTGYLSRLYVSHLNVGEGARADRPMLQGRIQPYTLFVPASYSAATPAPFVVALHSLSATHNQYAVFSPNVYRDLGEARDALVMAPAGRGPDGWWHDEAEADVFEAWADVAARYALDADHVSVFGYSMGGYGTYKLASQYPDLFTAGFAVVGPADEAIQGGPTGGLLDDNQDTLRIADNLRHVPVLAWFGTTDELVPVAGSLQVAARWQMLGYEHETNFFPGFDHFLLSIVDEWARGGAWLERPAIDRDPGHVTFKAMPEMDNAALGLVHDHAYWVQDVRAVAGEREALVDVRSLARGCEATTSPLVPPAGADPAPHVKSGRAPAGVVCASPAENALEVTLDGTSSVTLWPERGGITGGSLRLLVRSVNPATITLAGSWGSVVVDVPGGGMESAITL